MTEREAQSSNWNWAAQDTPLYSQQVSHQKWIWGSHKRESMQGIHPGFETQGRRHQKSKNRGINNPKKRSYVLQKFK